MSRRRRSDAPRRHEFVVSAVVVASFATFWVIAALVNDSPVVGIQYAVSATAAATVALPWVFAARLLWRAWWSRTGVRLSTMDGPARLLTAAATVLPDHRRVWGTAMTAELAQVVDRRARWRFAASCTRTAVWTPRAGRLPVVGVGLLIAGAMIVLGLTVRAMLPAMGSFAVCFSVLVGALALATAVRSPGLRRPAPGLWLAVAGLVAVGGCIAATAYAVSEHPGLVMPWATAGYLALALTFCLWIALAAPRAVAPARLARPVALGAAVVLGAGVLAEARLSSEGLLASFFLLPLAVVFVASAAVTVVGRSFRAGVQTAVWVTMLGVLTVFAVGLLEALRRFQIDAALILDAEAGTTFDENLVSLTFMLAVLPLWWLPFGVLGAAFGREMVSSGAPAGSGRGSCAPAP